MHDPKSERFAVTVIAVAFAATAVFLASLIVAHAARGAEPDRYAVAYNTAVDQDKPLIVLVGMMTCPPCKALERDCGVELRTRGVFLHLNADVQADRDLLAHYRLPVPRLVPRVWIWPRYQRRWLPPRVLDGPGVRLWLRGA